MQFLSRGIVMCLAAALSRRPGLGPTSLTFAIKKAVNILSTV